MQCLLLCTQLIVKSQHESQFTVLLLYKHFLHVWQNILKHIRIRINSNHAYRFSTFFNVSVATNVTARDLSNELSVIVTVVRHLACKSKPLTKKGISCPNPDSSSHWKAFYAGNFRQPSENHVITMWSTLFKQALLVYSVCRLVASGLLRLRLGDSWFRETRK